MEIAEALRRSRNEAGKSQEFMAFELGVSRRTIQHWESGVSEPTIGMAMDWFRLLEKNPLPFLLQHVFPDMDRISGKDDDEKLKKVLLGLIAELPPEGVRQLLYLFYGDHGSSPRAIMQMVTAHLQTPMKDRVTQAHIIALNYEMAKQKGSIARPDHIQPDLEFLKAAIEAGKEATVRDASEYSMPGRKT
ncbi:MAG: helix-turn-helix transcriptional regulator [Eubacteriales bacterium]|nr:helix-turn-helix transcriptional regulator [Eubacteriales bacterium]